MKIIIFHTRADEEKTREAIKAVMEDAQFTGYKIVWVDSLGAVIKALPAALVITNDFKEAVPLSVFQQAEYVEDEEKIADSVKSFLEL